MGKAVPKNIKSKANTLLATYPDKITTDFEANKRFIDSLGMDMAKTVRNLIAGFVTRKKAESK